MFSKIKERFSSKITGPEMVASSNATENPENNLSNELKAYKRKVEILEFENEQLKKGLTNIQSSLASSVDISNDSCNSFRENEDNFKTIIDKTGMIQTKVGELDYLVSDTKALVDNVNEKTDFVLNLVQTIEDIAFKSKLLSFNASIEAARAGEAGKGFAVVAMEVQKMSRETNDSLEQIKVGVQEITNSSTTLTSSMDETKKTADTISEEIEIFVSKLNQAIDTNSSSLEGVYSVNDRIFMSLAKIDHVVWKINTYLSILRSQEMFTFVDHNNCRLGKWYRQGEGYEFFKNTDAYSSLELPHSEVHNATKEVFDLLNDVNGQIEEINKAVLQMESSSDLVFDRLDQMLAQKS